MFNFSAPDIEDRSFYKNSTTLSLNLEGSDNNVARVHQQLVAAGFDHVTNTEVATNINSLNTCWEVDRDWQGTDRLHAVIEHSVVFEAGNKPLGCLARDQSIALANFLQDEMVANYLEVEAAIISVPGNLQNRHSHISRPNVELQIFGDIGCDALNSHRFQQQWFDENGDLI